MRVERWNETAEGELSESRLRRDLEARGYYRVTLYVYPPGTRFPSHSHEEDKIDAVLSGRLRMILQGQSAVLEAGDRLAVPRGVAHSAEVPGTEPVISLDAVRIER